METLSQFNFRLYIHVNKLKLKQSNMTCRTVQCVLVDNIQYIIYIYHDIMME